MVTTPRDGGRGDMPYMLHNLDAVHIHSLSHFVQYSIISNEALGGDQLSALRRSSFIPSASS